MVAKNSLCKVKTFAELEVPRCHNGNISADICPGVQCVTAAVAGKKIPFFLHMKLHLLQGSYSICICHPFSEGQCTII